MIKLIKLFYNDKHYYYHIITKLSKKIKKVIIKVHQLVKSHLIIFEKKIDP